LLVSRKKGIVEKNILNSVKRDMAKPEVSGCFIIIVKRFEMIGTEFGSSIVTAHCIVGLVTTYCGEVGAYALRESLFPHFFFLSNSSYYSFSFQ